MTKNFDELKEEMVQGFVDNFDASDGNDEVESWIKDTYPEFDITVDNSAMNKELNADDVMNSENIIKVNNEDELQDKEFTFDDDKWEIA